MPGPNDALESAKKFLADSSKRFPSTPAATTPSSANPTPAKPAAAAKGLAAELSAKQENVKQYKKASGDTLMPSMHDGGVVKKDGPHNLQKGEVVIAKDKVKSMKKADGLKAAMSEAKEEKAEPKSKDTKKEEASEKRAKHAVKRPRHMHISRAKGGFIVKHEYDQEKEPGAEMQQPEEPTVIPDMAGLHAHMDQHMGEPEAGDVAAEAMK